MCSWLISPGFPLVDGIRLIPRDKFERLYEENKNFECGLLMNNPDEDIEDWVNECKCIYMFFGANIVNTFNHLNGLEVIYRSH